MDDYLLTLTLQNAIEHDGKANVGPVLGRAMALLPDLRDDPKEASYRVGRIVSRVNQMTLGEQREELKKLGGGIDFKRRERKSGLPDLEQVREGKVIMRFAPGPSGPLHIGHTRAAMLNDEYCKRYQGKFILRIEDTNPDRIDPDAYSMIPEDLEWLDVDFHEKFIQSDRFEKYYDISRKLLEKGAAYVCTTSIEVWKSLKLDGKACKQRDQPPHEQLERWDRMLDGTYGEKDAFLIVKTDLEHKNPAVRDFVGMRIKDTPHPRTGDRYRVYPVYNLSVAIDDHLMGCTHILRGKDHLNNTLRQRYIYDHMGWKIPVFIHYGLVSIPDTILKTSLIREDITVGKYSGWSDVRLGTIRALQRRGFDPRSLREYWKEVGIKAVDITFSWDNLFSKNRSLIDGRARRYFFVPSPLKLRFRYGNSLRSEIPLHPEHPEMGVRNHTLTPREGFISVYVPEKEILDLQQGDSLRLKDLCNLRILDASSRVVEFAGKEFQRTRGKRSRIVQWVTEKGIEMHLLTPDGGVIPGLAEEGVARECEKGSVVQFERVGYCRLDKRGEDLIAYFGHP